MVAEKSVDQKSEYVNVEDSKRNQQLHYCRQSASITKQFFAQVAARTKFTGCISEGRDPNMPAEMDTNEDCLESDQVTNHKGKQLQ